MKCTRMQHPGESRLLTFMGVREHQLDAAQATRETKSCPGVIWDESRPLAGYGIPLRAPKLIVCYAHSDKDDHHVDGLHAVLN